MAKVIVTGGDSKIEMPAGGTITSGTMLQISAGTLIAATDGTSCAGIALETYASGDTAVAIVGDGQTQVRLAAASGFDPAPGDKLYIASATTVDGGSSTNLCCGVCVNSDPSEAGVVEFVLWTPATTGQYFAHA